MTTKFVCNSLLFFLMMSLSSCSEDDAGVPIANTETTFEIISDSPDHNVLEELLITTGLDQVLNSGAYTVFAPTDTAFNAIDTSNLSTEELATILSYHVIEGAAESSDLQTQYLSTLAQENLSSENNTISLYVNLGSSITLNGSSEVIEPNQLASNGVVHGIDQVLSIPEITTFATADTDFETLLSALTREDQPDFVNLLSAFDDLAPFTVFAPTNEAFSEVLVELGVDSLADIETDTLTSVLNTHVVSQNNFTSSALPQGTVETLGESFELDGTIIIDQNGRLIEIIVTDIQAGNGVLHKVDAVILPDLGLDPPPSTNTVSMTVDNDGASAYFVSEINGNEEVTPLNTNNSTWTLTVGTRYILNVTGANAHPFEIRNSSGDALLSQDAAGSFEDDAGVDFVENGTQFEFTLTSDLASEISSYFCTIHTNMNGSIEVNP